MAEGKKYSLLVLFSHEIRYKNKAHYKRILDVAKAFDVELILKGGKYVDPEVLGKVASTRVSPTVGGNTDERRYHRSVDIAGVVNHILFFAYLIKATGAAALRRRTVVYTFPGPHIPFVLLSKILFRRIVWIADIYDNPANLVTERFSMKWWLSRVNNFLQRAAYRNVDWAFITLARGSLSEYGIPDERTSYLTNGVDLRMFDPTKSEERHGGFFELAFVGYILKELGIDILIEAVDMLKQRIPDVRLNLVGFISDKDGRWLEDETAGRGLQDNIKFWGAIESEMMPHFLSRMDVCFIPFPPVKGKDETYPVKMFEFMAMGKAIISTRLTGVTSVLADGVDALIVEPRDPAGMAEAVHRIYSEPGLGERLGRSAREKAASYDWRMINDKVVERLAAIMGTEDHGSQVR